MAGWAGTAAERDEGREGGSGAVRRFSGLLSLMGDDRTVKVVARDRAGNTGTMMSWPFPKIAGATDRALGEVGIMGKT